MYEKTVPLARFAVGDACGMLGGMDETRIDDAADPRVRCYRNLSDRQLAAMDERFIAEGEYLVRRLLRSDFVVESVFVMDKRIERVAPLVPDGVPVYVAGTEVMTEITGVQFHAGVLACSRRKPDVGIDGLSVGLGCGGGTLLVCPEITNPANLGAIVRTASAFGVAGMILGESCCDPFYRQAVRTSMGGVFRVPIVRPRDLVESLDRLREEFSVELVAAVADPHAQPLHAATRSDRMAIVLGNEEHGLDERCLQCCDRQVTIPIARGTDSLNVAAAAAVLLYHYTSVAGA